MKSILLGALGALVWSVSSASAYYVAPKSVYRPAPIYHAPAYRPQTYRAPTYRAPVRRSVNRARTYPTTVRRTANRAATYRTGSRQSGARTGTQHHATTARRNNTGTQGKRIATRPGSSSSHSISHVTQRRMNTARAPIMTKHQTKLPPGVKHNPGHLVGSWGKNHGHQAFIYTHGGQRWHRWYYRWIAGGTWVWYWYDTPADVADVADVESPVTSDAAEAATVDPATPVVSPATPNVDPPVDTNTADASGGLLPDCSPEEDTCSDTQK